MSKIYVETRVFCPCSEEGVATKTKGSKLPSTITRSGSTHEVGDVYFCPSCQTLKCITCCHVHIESKYCSNCMADYSDGGDSRCGKNCFSCPRCESGLVVSVSDGKLGEKAGKIFKFKCVYCRYRYSTGTIVKPRPLASIIKGQKTQQDNGYSKRFAELQEHYSDRRKLHEVETRAKGAPIPRGPQFSGEMKQRLKDLELLSLAGSVNKSSNEMDVLRSKIDQCTSRPIDEEQDLENSRRVLSLHRLGDFVSVKRQLRQANFNSTMNNGSLMNLHNRLADGEQNQLPMPKKLSSKKSYTCMACRHVLSMPHKEPTLIKLQAKWNAIQYMPTLRISSLINKDYPRSLTIGKLYNLLINIINPLATEMDVVLSTMPCLPLEFISSTGIKVMLTLPVSSITIGGQSSKKDPSSIIKAIPTPFLTNRTKLARTEMIMRLGRLNSVARADDSMELSDNVVERGENWYLIPLNITVESSTLQESKVKLKIPFYITIKSQLPESMQPLNLPRKSLSYGYWAVLDIGEFLIES